MLAYLEHCCPFAQAPAQMLPPLEAFLDSQSEGAPSPGLPL